MMRRDVPRFAADASVSAFRDRFPLGSTTRVVLLDGEGHYAGIVDTAAAWSPEVEPVVEIGTLGKLPQARLAPEMGIGAVLEAFDRVVADDLVVAGPDGDVLGLITERHARRRYAEELERVQRELYGEV